MDKDLSHFDYIIVGNGLAGLQLALAFAEDSFFEDKQIALIDKDTKNTNDKTWSFWEKGSGKWDNIIAQKWDKALFFSSNKSLKLNLKQYNYKTIRAIDFYTKAKLILKQKDNFHFITEEVISIEDIKTPIISTNSNSYSAQHIFDSRIPPEFYLDTDNYTRILQHFKGLIIETNKPSFNPQAFTMMDYRLKDGEQTTFMYVLPFSETKALVEFTYFTSKVVTENTYDKFIKKYISKTLRIDNYKVTETESGSNDQFSFSKLFN